MQGDKDFSLEDSENLINNLKSNTSPEFEKLRTALNLLAHVHELSPISIPPALPSNIGQPVQLLARKSIKSRRTVITSILSATILASASLAAAAVTGRGPAPIVSAGLESAKFMKAVAGALSNAVTGNNADSPAAPPRPATNGIGGPTGEKTDGEEHQLTGPSSLPTSETDEHGSQSNPESSDKGGTSSPVPESQSHKPENSSKTGSKEHSRTPSAQPSPEPSDPESSGTPKPTSSPEVHPSEVHPSEVHPSDGAEST